MARYRGPKTKIARKFGEAIFGYDRSFEKRKYPPGQHGNSRRRGSKSEFSVQLKEKQKAKYTYGLLERQFLNLFKEAARRSGITGTIFLQLLEARLDNTVFRMGFAPSRRAARQLVSHKHIIVNGTITNIPSYQLKPGDTVEVREKSKAMILIKDTLAQSGNKFSWIDVAKAEMSGKFIDYPDREAIPENINDQLIVELYSK